MKPEEELPQPPEIPRRLVLGLPKKIGLPILLAVPVLALFDVFGVSRSEATAIDGAVEARLSYPGRFRYKMTDRLELRLRNVGPVPLRRVTVYFDEAYVASFSDVHFMPAPRRLSESAYEIDLDDIAPGETRRIHASLQADEFGRHRGAVTIAVEGAVRSRLPVDTLTFP